MKVKNNIPRRDFLKTASAAVIGAPYIVPSSVFGANAPSNRFTLGCIGMGGRGTADMTLFLARDDVQVVGVCDVYKLHRLEAKNIVEKTYAEKTSSGTFKGCDDYNDFREIIDRKDIDLVLITTPDHWHAIPAIMAADAGKDIYCEKPIGLTVEEGQAMCDAINRNGTIFQTGSQQRSDNTFRFGCELVRNGRIGKLHTIYVTIHEKWPCPEPTPEMPVPEGFDYNFWLGQAPWAPYTKLRADRSWRYQLAYSGGILRDWSGHHIDIAHWGMDTEHTGPVEIEGSGTYPREGLWDAATHFHFVCKYANGLIMDVASSIPAEEGTRFVGTEGWIFVTRWRIEGETQLTANGDFVEEFKELNNGVDQVIIPSQNQRDMEGNLIDAIRKDEKLFCNVDLGCTTMVAIKMGVEAYRQSKTLLWDAENEKVISG